MFGGGANFDGWEGLAPPSPLVLAPDRGGIVSVDPLPLHATRLVAYHCNDEQRR